MIGNVIGMTLGRWSEVMALFSINGVPLACLRGRVYTVSSRPRQVLAFLRPQSIQARSEGHPVVLLHWRYLIGVSGTMDRPASPSSSSSVITIRSANGSLPSVPSLWSRSSSSSKLADD